MPQRLTMVYWKGEQMWLGKLLEFPVVMTQGETVEELEENIKDAYRVLILEDVPADYLDKSDRCVKRAELIRRPIEAGCALLRHGGLHDVYLNPLTGQKQPIPRHSDIDEHLARHIRKYLGVK